jgi:hypothetical protein
MIDRAEEEHIAGFYKCPVFIIDLGFNNAVTDPLRQSFAVELLLNV